MVVIKLVESDDELAGIRHLQEINLKRNLSQEEIDSQGFVTAEYSMDILRLMHSIRPSIIAKEGNEVVGYVIATTKAIIPHHEFLAAFFAELDRIEYRGKSLKDVDYALSGQLCVGKSHRGQGLSTQMYNFYRDSMKCDFPFVITDIDVKNVGSIRAHEKVGFKELKIVDYWNETWKIIIWDWTSE